MELNAADRQLLASQYESVGVGETSLSSFGSMMALLSADESVEGAKKDQADHHSPPFMTYCHDPYHAVLLHAEQSGTPDQPSPYELMIAAVGNMHAVAAGQLDLGEGGGGDESIQKMQLQQQAAILVNKFYPKWEAAPPGAKNMPVSSVDSSHSNEGKESSAGLDMEGSGTHRMQLSTCSATCSAEITDDDVLIKEKIRAHPEYHKLVAAYINFRKVGAPPDVARRLEELSKEYVSPQLLSAIVCKAAATDPELDQFMENYCLALHKYEEELSKPFNEAMAFLQKVELQISHVSRTEFRLPLQGEGFSRLGMEDTQHEIEDLEEEEDEGAGGFGEVDFEMDASMDAQNEDKQLKEQLLRKYRGYISTLKHEFMKKKKKGKLPKDARQQLLDWWNEHSKWPYPTETEKGTLAETTGLDQKQINNWFINQRKRHWKPSDQDVQYVMVNGQDPPMHHHPPERR